MRLPLLACVGAWSFSGRAFTWCRPPSGGHSLARLATAGGRCHRPRRRSAWRYWAHRTGRLGRLSCGFARIPSTFTGRAVPSVSCRLTDHPAAAFVAAHDTQAVRRIALAVFVPRVSDYAVLLPRAFWVAPVETPPVRVIRGWCSSNSARSGPAPGHVLAAWPAALSRPPATSVGFADTLRSVAPAFDRG